MSQEPGSGWDDDYEAHPERAVFDNLEPFTWSDWESINYEAALGAIDHATGVYSSLIATEEAKPDPDEAVIEGWEHARHRCAEVRRNVDPTDHDQVARIRAEYSDLVRRLTADQ